MLTFYDMNNCKFFDLVRDAIPELRQFNNMVPKSMFKRLSLAAEAFYAGIRGMPRYKGRNRSVDSFTVPVGCGCTIRKSGFKHPKDWRTKTNGPHWGIYIMGFGFCRFKGSPPKGTIKEVTVQRTAKRINFIFGVEEVIEAFNRRDEPVTGNRRRHQGHDHAEFGGEDSGASARPRPHQGAGPEIGAPEEGEASRMRRPESCGRRSGNRSPIRSTGSGTACRLTLSGITDPTSPWRRRWLRGFGRNARERGRTERGRTGEISEQCWGDIARKISYKAEDAGGWLRTVDPAYTSLDCHKCGSRKKKRDLPLDDPDRLYECSCGLSMDRDENGAINIALRSIGKKPGRAEPGGIRLRCSSKQSEEGKSQNSGPSRLQAAKPEFVPEMGVHCGGKFHASGSLA